MNNGDPMRERYIVTKPSDDGTFIIGDRIIFESDGSVSCIEANGWVDAADVREAMRGVEYQVDQAHRDRRIRALKDELARLEGANG